MTSSLGIKAAVSSYEQVNFKTNRGYVRDNKELNENNDESDGFHPLKAKNSCFNKISTSQEVTNMNNSNTGRSNMHEVEKLYDHLGHSNNTVPIPVAWSPGMVVKPNPSLFITPQKSLDSTDILRSRIENILEPRIANKILEPVAWSPGMSIQMNPNLFITPEKSNDKKNDNDEKENIMGEASNSFPVTKSKLKYVRFNLPSSTSGDESFDHSLEADSPITLRGAEICEDINSFESPVWKAFSPQKTYNPNAYSDESSLDDSIMNSLPISKNHQRFENVRASNPTNSDPVTAKLNFNFSAVPSGTFYSNLSPSPPQNGDTQTLKKSELDTHVATIQNKNKKSSFHKSSSKSKIPSLTKVKLQNEEITTQTGPQDLRSPPSLYEPSPPASAVVREMKNSLLSTEYSYPFEEKVADGHPGYEHVFVRPEFHSNLMMRAELDNMVEQEVDVKKAVEITLARSEVKRSEINEKAVLPTNRRSQQFRNLVELDPSVESLCDRVIRMRTIRVQSKKNVHAEKRKEGSERVPDLMEFFTSDLQKECPDLTLPGVTAVSPQLKSAPLDVAFAVYRHNRLWQGIHDF